MLRISLILQLLFIGSCSSVQLDSPKSYELPIIKSRVEKYDKNYVGPSDKLSLSFKWAEQYLFAKKMENIGQNKIACLNYKSLSVQENFPLRHLSYVKTLEVCDLVKEELVIRWVNSDINLPNWLGERFNRKSLELSIKHNLTKFISSFSYEVSKYEKLQHLKIALMQDAIKYAEDENLKVKYTDRLYMIAPHLNPTINDENIYIVARDFERNRKFKEARKLYNKIAHDEYFKFEDRVKALNRFALTFKVERKLEEFRKETKKISNYLFKLYQDEAENVDYKKAWLLNQINVARAVWTNHREEEAKKILLNLLEHNILDEEIKASIYRILGGISLESKKWEEALAYFSEGQRLEILDEDIFNQINWNVGWMQYQLRMYEKAANSFKTFRDKVKELSTKAKLKYWEAISRKNTGDLSFAEDLFEELVHEDTFGYYGILANRELDKPFLPVNDFDEIDYTKILEFEWLVAMEEYDEGKIFLDNYAANVEDESDRIKLLPLYARTNCFDLPIYQFYKVQTEKRDELLENVAYIVFPTPFEKEVAESSKQYGVDKHYIYSIMRQESSFNPNVRSWAHAFGLMQLIPERASALSVKYNIPYNDYMDLYNIETNIQMGAALLKDMRERFEDSFILATASYNASERAIKQWVEDRYDNDTLKFVEMIPYKETRNYIKYVLRNYINYKRIDAKESFNFPENLLKIK